MNEQEAQQFLADRGPWNIRINGSEFVFENDRGDVMTVDMYVEPGYPECLDDLVVEFTVGVRA